MADPVGFLLVDKPSGPTSHDIVDAARRAVGIRKVGHAGTLDPMATGLLILGVGKATRLLRFVEAADKEYEAVARLGVLTDTLDATGAILSREPTDAVAADLEAVSGRFIGPIMQIPPMASALKVGGRRLHELARAGQQVDRPARPVNVQDLDIRDVAPGPFPEVALRVVCSKGTYIRSLADDLAAAAGTRAHLTALRRVRIGPHHVDAALTIDELASRWESSLVSPAVGLSGLPAASVDAETAAAVRHGAVFPGPVLAPGIVGPFRVLSPNGDLLAVYRTEGTRAKPEVVTA